MTTYWQATFDRTGEVMADCMDNEEDAFEAACNWLAYNNEYGAFTVTEYLRESEDCDGFEE